jgi:hypothetical protein
VVFSCAAMNVLRQQWG